MKRGVRIGILPLEIFQSLEKASSNLPIIGKNVTGFSNVWKILLVLLIAAPAFGQMATVTNTIPHNGSNAVEQTANIVAQFDQSMRGSTITSNTFFLYSSQRGMNRGAITFNTATNRAALNPSRDLLPGDFVNATLTRSITNAAGTVGLRHHTWTFVGAVTNLVGFFDQIGSDRSMTDCIDVALGDVDNDGDLDAVIVGFNGSPTRVYTNKGDGVLSDSGQTLSHANGRAVALGDLDRDGDLDVVVANSGGPSRLWTNNGSGLFFQNGQSLTTNSAKDVALGDFDGDGWLDAIFADGQTTVWTNNRTGKLYETARHIADSSYGLVAVGDVNGDGYLDACMGRWSAAPRVLTNNGSAAFYNTAQALPSLDTYAIALGDLDGDGALDLATAGMSGNSRIFTNDGAGTFFDTGQDLGQQGNVALGDMDGDGDLDFMSWMLYTNDGNAMFSTSSVTIKSGYGHNAVGDLVGDGDLDVVMTDWNTDKFFVYRNERPQMLIRATNFNPILSGDAPSTANGTDFGQVAIGASWTNRFYITNSSAYVELKITGVTTSGASASDFAVMGMPATVWEHTEYTFQIAYTPTYAGVRTATIEIANTSTNSPYLLNVTGYYPPPIVTNVTPPNATNDFQTDEYVFAYFSEVMKKASINSNTFFAYSEQNGVYPRPVGKSAAGDVAYLTPVPGIFRAGDLVYVQLTKQITNSAGTGTLVPYAWSFYTEVRRGYGQFSDSGQTPGTGTCRAVALGDLNGDGWLDAFIGNDSQPDEVWTNDGSGVLYDSGQMLNTGATRSVSLGDVDRDGDLDAYVVNANQQDRIWTNNGGVFYDSGQLLAWHDGRDSALVDFDGDGDLDIFIVKRDDPDQMWRNDGTGQFSNSGQGIGNGPGSAVAIGDVNGDGFLDAYVANFSAANRVFTNNEDGVFSGNGQSLGTARGQGVAMGDLNGDGWLDAFVVNGGGDPDTVWTNDGTGMFYDSGQVLGTDSGRGVALGDLEGDGDLDAFVANYGGPNRVWTNNGQGVFSDSGLALGSSDSWNVALGDVNGNLRLDALVANNSGGNRLWINYVPQPTVYTNRQAFYAALPAFALETFERGDPGSCSSPVDITSDNLVFEPGDIQSGIRFAMEGSGFELDDRSGQSVYGGTYVLRGSSDNDLMEITFPNSNVFALGFDTYVEALPNPATLVIYDPDGIVLLEQEVYCGPTGSFFGVTDTALLSRVEIDPGGSFAHVDNVAFTPVGWLTYYATREAFQSSNNLPVEDFEDGTLGSFSGTNVSYQTENAVFDICDIYRGVIISNTSGGFELEKDSGFGTSQVLRVTSDNAHMFIDFTPSNTAAFALETFTETFRPYAAVTIYGPGTALMDRVNWASDPSGEFMGLMSSSGRIALVEIDPGGSFATIDNLAFEADIDCDHDGLPDDWERRFFNGPTNATASGHSDDDGVPDGDEYGADTIPTNGQSYFHLTGLRRTNSFAVTFVCTNSRVYSLGYSTNLMMGEWWAVNGATNVPGDASGSMSLTDPADATQRSYRVGVALP